MRIRTLFKIGNLHNEINFNDLHLSRHGKNELKYIEHVLKVHINNN